MVIMSVGVVFICKEVEITQLCVILQSDTFFGLKTCDQASKLSFCTSGEVGEVMGRRKHHIISQLCSLSFKHNITYLAIF